MTNEEWAEKWKRQAQADIKAAGDSLKSRNYEWACFAAQQAAEKMLKSYLFGQGQRVLTTHSLRKLILEAADHDKRFKKAEQDAKLLDNFYFTTRYPDALADDIPADYFSEADAKEALRAAERIKRLI